MSSENEVQAQIAQLYKSLPESNRALALQALLDQSSKSSNSVETSSSSSDKKRLLASSDTPNEGGSRKVYLSLNYLSKAQNNVIRQVQLNREYISLLSDSEDDFSTSRFKQQSVAKPSQLSNSIEFTKSSFRTVFTVDSDSNDSLPSLFKLEPNSFSATKPFSTTRSVGVKNETNPSTTTVLTAEK